MTKQIIFIFTTIICTLNIWLWPVNEYEWMLYDDPGITLPVDNEAGVTAFIAITPIIFLLPFLFSRGNGIRIKVVLSVLILLLGFWFYKFGKLIV